MFKKGISVIVPLFNVTLCLLMLHSYATTPFSLSSFVTSQVEDDDLLVYTISSPASPTPTPSLVPVKPPLLRYILDAKTLQFLVQHWLLHHQIQSIIMIFRLLFV